jgi:hypothetical protein
MAKQVVVLCASQPDGSHIHRLRDFGEELFVKFRSGDQAVINLEEVDRATDRFVVHVAKRGSARRIARAIEVKMDRHFPDGIASIAIEDIEKKE